MKCYLSYIIGITLLFINFVNSRSLGNLSNDDKKIKKGDNYYLIFVNNEHGEYKVYPDSEFQKREESQVFIESLVDEINNLIIENKDTYENPEKLEEIENNSQIKRRKRSEEDQKVYYYDESDFVYPISSVNNSVVLLGYLSEKLAKELPSKFDSVISCDPDEAVFKNDGHNYFDEKEILAETKWKKLSYRKNDDTKHFDGHLALISQGKFTKDKYFDDNYYYPQSAGKNVDLIILDSSFNFDYSEFSNTLDRKVQCVGIITDSRFSSDVSQGCNISRTYHGETTSDVAAGLKFGVANRANIYGIVLKEYEENGKFYFSNSVILTGFQYVYEHMIKPHQTVINISISGSHNEDSKYYQQLNQVIGKITKMGGIVVSSAGNDNLNLDIQEKRCIPCELDDVICVGGINNKDNHYNSAYKKSRDSNYGERVDLYSPYFAFVSYKKNDEIKNYEVCGTSYSSPIVAGIIATIIGENTDIKYTKESMLEQLKKNGKDFKVGLFNGKTGILANNGKRSVYYKTECYGQELDYTCCDSCLIASKEQNGFWGVENKWCGIRYSCKTLDNEWYGQQFGYPACSGCTVESADQTGKYATENGQLCGIRFSC